MEKLLFLSFVIIFFGIFLSMLYAGEEFQVNTYIKGDQSEPSIAMDSEGNFVIAWTSWEQDGSGPGVFAQRFDMDGSKLSDEFQVNNYTYGPQWNPSIAMNHQGIFVITWQN